jgi:hypothetical protein
MQAAVKLLHQHLGQHLAPIMELLKERVHIPMEKGEPIRLGEIAPITPTSGPVDGILQDAAARRDEREQTERDG